MINNFELIKPLLLFPTDDIFYFVQLLQRKKEHSELGRNSNNIKNYNIKSLEYLDKKTPEIIGLCNHFNARAYIRLTPRSWKKTAYHNLKQVTSFICDENYEAVGKSYLSTCGTTNAGILKRWIVDVDGDKYEEDRIRAAINFSRPNEGEDKVIAKIPSKNGYHLITHPFDKQQFKMTSRMNDVEIHSDNPSNLFIP